MSVEGMSGGRKPSANLEPPLTPLPDASQHSRNLRSHRHVQWGPNEKNIAEHGLDEKAENVSF
jgi:hypothetical protein